MNYKNNYPLCLISNIIENIGTKKVFTKMDLRWGYNNIWIKEGNEWKVAFTILEGLFEPTVMFFRLMNSSVIFQTDEQTLMRLYQYWEGSELYRWCNNKNRDRGGAWWDSRENSKAVSIEQSIHETREMQVEGEGNRILGNDNRT